MDFPPSSNNGESCRCSIPIWFGFPSVCKVHKVPYHHHHYHHHTISLPHQATNIFHTRKHNKAHQTDIQLPWLSFVLFTCSAEHNIGTKFIQKQQNIQDSLCIKMPVGIWLCHSTMGRSYSAAVAQVCLRRSWQAKYTSENRRYLVTHNSPLPITKSTLALSHMFPTNKGASQQKHVNTNTKHPLMYTFCFFSSTWP